MSQKSTASARTASESGALAERLGWLRRTIGGRADMAFEATRPNHFADTEAQGFPDTEPLPLAELPHLRSSAAAHEGA